MSDMKSIGPRYDKKPAARRRGRFFALIADAMPVQVNVILKI
jgi:hypothetical protein